MPKDYLCNVFLFVCILDKDIWCKVYLYVYSEEVFI